MPTTNKKLNNRAVLLANLGSPAKPDETEMRRYLNQFLMDPDVIQLPWLVRRLLVSLFILPRRPKSSVKAYQSIWTSQGSPLLILSEQLRKALQKQSGLLVGMSMRYGQPSIESQLLELAKQPHITEILFVPLYPQYAESTVSTSIKEAKRVIKKHKLKVQLTTFDVFFKHPNYINALIESAKPYLEQPYDHLLFSYHGLPELHLTKLDKSKKHCLKQSDCCFTPHPAHKTCYRHQVYMTTGFFVKQAAITHDKYSIAFQSRLGRAKWLSPSTEERLRELAEAGCKNILVICPAFVTDCLETLEEIAIRGQQTFIEAGGESLTLIPCLNDHPVWVNTLADWCSS